MPVIKDTINISNFSDGAGLVYHTVDLSKELSNLYGKLVRQGQVFKISSIMARAVNPNTVAQDNSVGASGNFVFFHPTANRKKAWLSGFKAVQAQRRLLGLKERGYDFRVGFHRDYGNVPYQAFIRDENEKLVLGYHDDQQNSLFMVHNNFQSENRPVEPMSASSGFGTPYDTPGLLPDELDFHDGDTPYYNDGMASITMDAVPFSVSHAGGYDDSGSGGDWGAITNADHQNGPFWSLCGLVGVKIDTTVPDDSETQTQDTEIEVYINVESWKPIISKKKTRRKSRGKRRSRK